VEAGDSESTDRVNKLLTRSRARVKVSRTLLPQVHRRSAESCWHDHRRSVHGTFDDAVFLRSGNPVVNGYGLTEAGTALTLNDLKPFRADTVGKPLPAWNCGAESERGGDWGNCGAKQDGDVALSGRCGVDAGDDRRRMAADGRFGAVRHKRASAAFRAEKNMIVTEAGRIFIRRI